MVPFKKISILLLLILHIGTMQSQISEKEIKSETIKVNGAQTHYLDFGGEGINVILLHSEGWDAFTYQDFGPLLTASNRVLAITRPGYGSSETTGYDVKSQGDHLIKFADALEIKKAVFIGNSSVTAELTYLAENYSQRVAGVVYLNGLSVPWLEEYYKDPTQAFEMFLRASPSVDLKTDFIVINEARKTYRPNHYISDSVKIKVPALAIVSRDGSQGTEKGLGALVYVGSPFMEDVRNEMPPSSIKDFLDRLAYDHSFRNDLINNIQDSVTKVYFLELASDTVMQKKMYKYHTQVTYPAILNAQDQLKNAFGENLQLQRVDVNQIIGYEYRDCPELIVRPIKTFLDQLDSN